MNKALLANLSFWYAELHLKDLFELIKVECAIAVDIGKHKSVFQFLKHVDWNSFLELHKENTRWR